MMNKTQNVMYREATPSDIEALLGLEQKVVEAERPFNQQISESGVTYYDLSELIANVSSLLLVGECQSQIVATGYVDIRQSKSSLKHAKHGYLGFMYVEPEFRGQGINKKILDKLIDWAKERNIRDFYLDVYAENSAAIKAYEKAGFKSSLIEMQLTI
ncbi:GNAT family N-acetyltransferase [Thalassotalea fusca]